MSHPISLRYSFILKSKLKGGNSKGSIWY